MIELGPAEASWLAIAGFQAMQKVSELRGLLEEVLALHPVTILEIGVGKGGTSWLWTKLTSAVLVVAIDLPDGPWGGGPGSDSIQYIGNNSRCNFVFIAGNSQDDEVHKRAFSAVEQVGGYDFIHIDGDHSYAGVRADFEKYKAMLRPGGFIAFHDICEHAKETGCEVSKFWQELLEMGVAKVSDKDIFIGEPQVWGGIGIIRYENLRHYKVKAAGDV